MKYGFKRPAYWSKYKAIPNRNETGTNDEPESISRVNFWPKLNIQNTSYTKP